MDTVLTNDSTDLRSTSPPAVDAKGDPTPVEHDNQQQSTRKNRPKVDWAAAIWIGAVHVGALAAPWTFSWAGLWLMLAMYFLARRLEKDRFVWIMGVTMLTGVLFLSGSLAAVGNFQEEQIMATLAVLLPSWAGLTAGAYVRRRVSQDTFRRVALIALFVMGVSLLGSLLGPLVGWN